MSKVFTADKFIEKLKHVASLPTTYYSVSGGDWAMWNGRSWNFDCVILVKALLWGWCENKNHPHGGAIYASNGVKDDNADTIITRCDRISTDFTNITPGELLWMPGHVGVYIGDGRVIECTAAWEHKVLYSSISSTGLRSKDGRQVGYWRKHGRLPYIEYNDKPVPAQDSTGIITYKAYDGQWLPSVNKCDNTDDGYAGEYGKPISGLKARCEHGEIFIESHILGYATDKWLSKISSKDYYKDDENSYSGIYDRPIDCVRITSTCGWVKYRVHIKNGKWLPWVDSRTKYGSESYAGIYGKEIDGIQMY